MLKNLGSFIYLKKFGDTLDANDFENINKFMLFRAFSLTAFVITLAINIQNINFFGTINITSGIIIFLSLLIAANYFALNFHKKMFFANLTILILSLAALHFVTYFSGGIRNSGTMYLGSFILTAFMLLGNKYGKAITFVSVINIVYFYILNTFFPETILNIMDDGTYQLIDLDYLITGSSCTLLIFALSNNLENSKNIIVKKIKESYDELEVKNTELSLLSLVASKTENSVVITGSKGKVEWVNNGFERLTGYSFEEVRGKKLNDFLLGPESDANTVFQIKEHVRNRQSFNGEIKKYKKNGESFWAQMSQTPIVKDNGEIDRFIIVESDITGKKEAEAKMIESYARMEKVNKELDKFAYIVSHDLKAPLRAISNLTAWIEEDSAEQFSVESRGHFEMIKGRLVRMEALINGILDYSKADRVKSNSIEFELADLVMETTNFVLPSDQTSYKLAIKSKLPHMKTDKIKFSQLMSNLIGNAYKHNKNENPEIGIECVESEDEFEFIVSDNGLGIEKQYHEKIFIIFQTLEARDKFESTGVGLAISKKIVEDAGGKIWVESELGQGSQFHFTWPKNEKKSIYMALQEKSLVNIAS